VVDDLVQNRAGRGDDEAHIDGHRLSCATLEAVLTGHHAVAEAAVVAVDAPGGRSETLWAFITPDPEIMASDVLGADIKGFLRREVGPHAVPTTVIFGPLPKTHSGEVVRGVLRRIAETGEPGDVSGLEDPAVAPHLAKLRAEAVA
jgi:acetyl-CoA synthetase